MKIVPCMTACPLPSLPHSIVHKGYFPSLPSKPAFFLGGNGTSELMSVFGIVLAVLLNHCSAFCDNEVVSSALVRACHAARLSGAAAPMQGLPSRP